MIIDFSAITDGILYLISHREPVLRALEHELITTRKNSQGRTIKQILGHLIDSASNNTHRIVHMQYQPSPLIFPNYATQGNNDRWIAIQNYQQENWEDMIALWKALNLHIIHVIKQVDITKIENQWRSGDDKLISLKENIMGYLPHLQLHLDEIEQLCLTHPTTQTQ